MKYEMPMMPLAHMMNNPMTNPGFIRKPDFPPDMQPIFVIPQIAHIKTTTKSKCRKYDATFYGKNSEWIIDKFEDEFERAEREAKEKDYERPSRLPLKLVKKLIKKRAHRDIQQKLLHEWNPFEDKNTTQDPFKTLFVARLSYATTEKRVKREFEQYGPIKSVRIIRDHQDKPRGYAFIEFEHKNDMKTAFKYSEGKKIEGRKVVVDYERGRTVLKFRPRRLGGGLGELRQSEEDKKIPVRVHHKKKKEKKKKN